MDRDRLARLMCESAEAHSDGFVRAGDHRRAGVVVSERVWRAVADDVLAALKEA